MLLRLLTFNFLVERCVTFDFGKGVASYSDIFH